MPASARPPVQVYLTAFNKGGSPATLSQSDLSVFINKKPAQMTALRSAKEDKLLFALLVDVSTSDATKGKEIKEAANLLFQGLSADGSQGYLVLFDYQVEMSKKPLQPSTVQKVLDSLKFGGGTALYDAIEDTCTQILSRLGNPDTPRRAIFLISDGNDNSSRIYPAKALEIAEGEGVAIFTLDIEQIESHGERFLKEASHDTGGQAIVSKKLGDGVTPLLNAVNAQWALGIMPPQASDQKRHSLTVKTSRKDVHLSAPANIFFH